jgi:hypothetical protein
VYCEISVWTSLIWTFLLVLVWEFTPEICRRILETLCLS